MTCIQWRSQGRPLPPARERKKKKKKEEKNKERERKKERQRERGRQSKWGATCSAKIYVLAI